MRAHGSVVSCVRGSNVSYQLRAENVYGGHSGLERTEPPDDLVSVISRHPDWSDATCFLARMKHRRTTHVRTAVRQVHRPLGEMRELREKIAVCSDHFMTLTANASHLPRYQHIAAIAVRPSKGV